MVVCSLCGSVEFLLEAGFYYCKQCQTQIEDDQEEVYDSIHNKNTERKKVDGKKKKSNKKTTGEEFTSWEMYNIILRGFVDQMISLGASKDLKLVVLQLWTAYLARNEVAFCGRKGIRFNLGYKKRDVELLSNKKFDEFANKTRRIRDKIRMKRPSTKSKAKSGRKFLSVQDEKRRERILKQKKILEESTNLTKVKRKFIEKLSQLKSQENEDFIDSSQLQLQSQTLENLTQKNEDGQEVLDRFNFSKHSRSILSALKSHSDHLNPSKHKELLNIVVENYRKSAHNLTLTRLIGILQLGMVLSHQDAQIGDTLRWMTEGHLSFEDPEIFFEPGVKINFQRQIKRGIKMTHTSIGVNLKMIGDVLSIKILPAPNIFRLTARYCLELQLPDELLEKVHELLLLYPPKENFSEVIKFEARAMSYVIVALKLFFGLDGVTEKTISDAVDFFNRKLKDGCDAKFFSWTEWVNYIECRKTIVSYFHYPTRLVIGNAHYAQGDRSAFPEYWNKRHFSFHKKPGNSEKIFGDRLECTLDGLIENSSDSNDFEFPASLTPMLTYTKELLSNHSHKLNIEACNILKQSFTTRCLLHQEMFHTLTSYANIIESNSSLRCMKKVPMISLMPIQSGFPIIPVKTVVIKEDPSPTKISVKRKRSHLDESLSKITERLLKKRLVEVEGKLRENGNNLMCDKTGDFRYQKRFTLSKPFEHYWYLQGNFCSKSDFREDFDEISKKLFSSSFLWLLKECSRMIGIIPRDLYCEVVSTEVRLK